LFSNARRTRQPQRCRTFSVPGALSPLQRKKKTRQGFMGGRDAVFLVLACAAGCSAFVPGVGIAQRYVFAIARTSLAAEPGQDADSRIQRVKVGGRELKLRQLSEQQRGSRPGLDLTGLDLWPTTDVLLERLQQQLLPSLQQERQRQFGSTRDPLRVLELGAGCGVLGISLAAMGEQVVLTDIDLAFGESTDSTLRHLEANVALNRDIVGKRAEVRRLAWGDDEDITEVAKLGPFDLIVGCDLVYDPDLHVPLLQTLRQLSATPDARAFLAYNTLYIR
jgi:hypothetical protein